MTNYKPSTFSRIRIHTLCILSLPLERLMEQCLLSSQCGSRSTCGRSLLSFWNPEDSWMLWCLLYSEYSQEQTKMRLFSKSVASLCFVEFAIYLLLTIEDTMRFFSILTENFYWKLGNLVVLGCKWKWLQLAKMWEPAYFLQIWLLFTHGNLSKKCGKQWIFVHTWEIDKNQKSVTSFDSVCRNCCQKYW